MLSVGFSGAERITALTYCKPVSEEVAVKNLFAYPSLWQHKCSPKRDVAHSK